jgi:eukaryotic-like serine/threonine-protein kinase
MPLTPGTRLGYYEITAPLGAGGMGEVYKARDTRLGRDVAIKALSDGFANAADRLARFQREAQILGSLNHSNIAAIYELEEQNGARYLVLEFVPGETLAERIRRGPLTVEESLEIAAQIAEALEAAHEKGVVHRDLKPANIKITPDGKVKVLDFGLAKDVAMDRSDVRDALNSPTLTVASPADTRAGVILGTAAYMSPEQARGKPVDKRTDIWAFGCILFECLTGKMAFGGETVTDTLAAVVKAEPEWRALPAAASHRVRDLLRRCLQKDPRLRLRDIGDARILITEALSGDPAAAVSSSPRPLRRLSPLLTAACLAALVLGLIVGMWWKGRSEPAGVWTGAYLGGPELSTMPRPSPDGHLLAFVAKDNDDVMQVWVMKPESGNRVMLTHRRDVGFAGVCSWSADGGRIFYDRYSDQLKGIYSVPALGGDEQMILETGGTPEALPDGSLLISQINQQHEQQLYRYWPDSGKSQAFPVILPNGTLYGWSSIRAFPDGRRALVAGTAAGDQADTAGLHFYIVDLETGKLRLLEADFGDLVAGGGFPPATVTLDGKAAIFGNTLGPLSRVMSIPIDGPAPAQQLFTLTGYLQSLAIGADGDIYLDQADRPMEIVRFAPEGGRVERIASVPKPVGDYFASLSDGRAVWAEYAAGHRHLMIGTAGKEPTPLIRTSEDVSGPLTAVGSGAVAFLVDVETHPTIAVATLSTGRIVRRIPFNKGRIEQMASSPDGKTLYCAASGSIWAVTTDGEVRRQRAGNFVTVEPSSQSLLVEVRESPNTKLVRVPLDGGAEQEIRVPGPLTLGYMIDNDGVRNGRLLAPGSGPTWYWPPTIFDLATGKSARIPLEYVSDFHHMSWTPDGKVMACALVWRSNMWKFTRSSH